MYAMIRRTADALLCVSEFSAREYTRFVGAGRASLTTVHSGVEERWFTVTRRKRPYPRPFFLFVGNVKPNKNVRTLLRAFNTIRDLVPHDLVIVGKREGFVVGDPEIAPAAASLGDRVHFTGFVARDDLEQFIAFADALVMPSLYEGFGLPPLEAMAASCPVVASNAASLPEICGDAALYFDPTDHESLAASLLRLVGDATLQQQLRRRGLQQARRFQWDSTVSRTLAVLDSLVTN
jgi:glycosyltransferase involved in cell wall biosynthesis